MVVSWGPKYLVLEDWPVVTCTAQGVHENKEKREARESSVKAVVTLGGGWRKTCLHAE